MTTSQDFEGLLIVNEKKLDRLPLLEIRKTWNCGPY